MGLFERLERALERLIEGRLMGAVRGRVHPIEIARHVAHQMQTQRRIGVHRTYVPNVFQVLLNPTDLEPLEPIKTQVEEEIVGYLERQVRERDFSLPGRIRVELVGGDDAASGTVRVTSEFERDASGDGMTSGELAAAQPTAPSADVKLADADTHAVLLGNGGFVQGKVIPLKGDVLLLGRSADCHIHVPDGQVSKTHARLAWNGETYVLTSVGRNGTRVNGRLVSSSTALQNGDDIAVGSSLLHYRMIAGG